MTATNSRPYGHAYCPHCKNIFDTRYGTAAFFVRSRNDALYFLLCPQCFDLYGRLTPKGQEIVQSLAFKNTWRMRTVVAAFTHLALEINGNIVDAIERGIDMPRSTYNAISLSDEALLPTENGFKHIRMLPAKERFDQTPTERKGSIH